MADDLIIGVGLDVDNATRGARDFNNEIDKLDGGMSKASGSAGGLLGGITGMINPMGLAVAGVGALGAGLASTIGPAAEFDQVMANIKATSSDGGQSLGQLRQLALDLGMANDVGAVSASDAANAILELNKAGITAEAQLGGVTKSVLQLAAASGGDMGVADAATLASDAMATFKMEASDMGGIVNTMVGAANASTIGLNDLKFGLSAAGSVAATVGMSFEDTATALALFGQNGLKGSDAGTSFKTMLMGLQPNSAKAASQMLELGIITADGANAFFDAQGHVKSLSEIAGVLTSSMAGLTDQQRLSALETMFGSDAVRAAAILYGEGATGVNDMATAMTAQGNASATAATMSDNLKSKWEAFQGTIETLQISIGSALAPALSSLIDIGNQLLGGVLAGLPTAFSTIGTVVSQVAGIIGPMFGQSVGQVQGSFGQIQAVITGAMTQVQAIVGSVLQIVMGFWQENGAQIMAFVQSAWSQIQSIISTTVGVISSIVQSVLSIVGQFISEHSEEIQGLLTLAWQTIQTIIEGALAVIQNVVIPVLTAIASFISEHSDTIKTVLETAWNLIKGIIESVLGIIRGVVQTITGLIKGDWQMAWDGIKGIAESVWNLIKGVVENGIALVKSVLDLGIQAVKGIWDGFWNNVWPTLSNTLAELANNIAGWVGQLASDAFNWLISVGEGIINGIVQGLQNAGHAILDFLMGLVQGAVQAVKDFFHMQSPSRLMMDIGENIGLGMALGIEGSTGAVSSAMGKLMGAANPELAAIGGGVGVLPIRSSVPGAIGQGGGGGGDRSIVIEMDGYVVGQIMSQRLGSRGAITAFQPSAQRWSAS